MDNVSCLKGYSIHPNAFGATPPTYASIIAKNRIWLNPHSIIQIWQDTVVDTMVASVRIASATDRFWGTLYRVNAATKGLDFVDIWEVVPSATGMLASIKSTPITLTPGTYMVGHSSLDETAQSYRMGTFSTMTKSPIFDAFNIPSWTSNGAATFLYVVVPDQDGTNHPTFVDLTDPAVTQVPITSYPASGFNLVL